MEGNHHSRPVPRPPLYHDYYYNYYYCICMRALLDSLKTVYCISLGSLSSSYSSSSVVVEIAVIVAVVVIVVIFP